MSNSAVATFTHANGVEPAGNYTATINWGDGKTSTGTITQSGATYTVKGSHTYSKSGTYTVTTTVVDSQQAVQNSMMMASASMATTAAATTAASPNAAATASDNAAVTSTTDSGPATAVNSTSPASTTIEGAGAQLVADLDSLDALFELLSGLGSDALHLD